MGVVGFSFNIMLYSAFDSLDSLISGKTAALHFGLSIGVDIVKMRLLYGEFVFVCEPKKVHQSNYIRVLSNHGLVLFVGATVAEKVYIHPSLSM